MSACGARAIVGQISNLATRLSLLTCWEWGWGKAMSCTCSFGRLVQLRQSFSSFGSFGLLSRRNDSALVCMYWCTFVRGSRQAAGSGRIRKAVTAPSRECSTRERPEGRFRDRFRVWASLSLSPPLPPQRCPRIATAGASAWRTSRLHSAEVSALHSITHRVSVQKAKLVRWHWRWRRADELMRRKKKQAAAHVRICPH